MELWIATSNSSKVGEIRLVFQGISEVSLHTQDEISGFTPRPEDGKTFLDNARIKARTLKSIKSEFWVLGEDSGLEVEGLGNLPGVHSARYAGNHASDSENVAKLLKMMTIRAVSNRSAQFVCSLVALAPNGEEHIFNGVMKGKIANKPAGQTGFGYDPIFIPEGQDQTLAELGPGFKNQFSHRAQALKGFLKKLKS